MKKITLLSIFSLLFLVSMPVDAQIMKFGIGGGLTMVQSPDYLTSETMGAGMSTEFHIGAKAKFSLPMIPIVPVGFVNYHFLNGTVTPPPVAGMVPATIETSSNILSIGAGGELSLVPGPISPYLALDLMYNYFGEISSINSSSISRGGLAIGAGADLSIMGLPGFDVSVKYNIINLIGKETGEDTMSTINLSAFLLF